MQYLTKTVVRRSKAEGDKARTRAKAQEIKDACSRAGNKVRGLMHETIDEFATSQRMARWGK